jgi:hypothetical protein
MATNQTFTPIYTVNTGAVGAISITGISQSYTHLVITGGFTRNIAADAGGRGAEFQFNGITSGYRYRQIANLNDNYFGTTTQSIVPVAGNLLYAGRGNFEAWIFNYRNTNFHKHATIKYTISGTNASGGYTIITNSLIPTTAAISSIYIYQNVDTFVNGDGLTIWGVSNA